MAVLVSVTSAPEIAAPEASLTVPEIEPKVDWPRAVKQPPSKSPVARIGNQNLCEITEPPKMFRKPAGPIGPYVPGPTSTVSSAFLPPVFYTESSILANSAVVQLYGDEIEERNARQHTCDLNFCFFVFTESAVDLRSTDRTSDGYEWGHRTGSRGHFNKTSDQDSAGHGASKKFHTKVRLSITKQYEARRASVPVEERNKRGPLKLHGEMALERRLVDANAGATFPG